MLKMQKVVMECLKMAQQYLIANLGILETFAQTIKMAIIDVNYHQSINIFNLY